MIEQIKPNVLLANLELPEQTLEELSFCGSNKPAVLLKWLDNLRATQVKQTSMQLYQAAPEIVQLKTSYATRLEMLETIRARVQDSIEGLQKGFLNQPIIMPEEAQKAVLIAQSLQKSMIDGYLVCILQISQQVKARKSTLDDLAKAIHRAISGIGLLYFRSCQIYSQMPQHMWFALHALYQIAEFYDVTQQPVEDITLASARPLPIEAAYTRVLMLGAARTNQLNQADIATAYRAFERWCLHVKLHSVNEEHKDNFLVVDLRSEQGPIAKRNVKKHINSFFLELDFAPLLGQLRKSPGEAEHISPSKVSLISDDFPNALLKHLREAWGVETTRKVDRRQVNSAAHLCIGLVDCHYYFNNSIEFDQFVFDPTEQHNPPASIPNNVTPAPQAQEERRPQFKASIQNISPGGYCLLWEGEIPAKVVAGELIGIKEIGRRTWELGVIRWVRQLKGASQLGIQILSPNPKPYAIAQTYSMGGYSDYMRGFLIPASRFGNTEQCLLTGAVPFEEHDKVKLCDGQQEWSAKLEEQLFATKNIQQFTFQTIDKLGDIPKASKTASDTQYSSWDDI